MINKRELFGKDVENRIQKASNIIAQCVGSTHGPGGQNVLLDQDGLYPQITKDGVSVARDLYWYKDKELRIPMQIMIEAANKQLMDAGDGTTTTIVIADEIINQGYKAVEKGTNPALLRRGIEKAMNRIVTDLKSISKPVKTYADLKNIATIATNNDKELGDMIASAIHSVGEYGSVEHEKGKTEKHEVVYTTGYKWKRGIPHWYMTDQKKMRAEHSDPFILVTDMIITKINEIEPIVEKVVNWMNENKQTKPLVIICDEIMREPRQALIENHVLFMQKKGNFANMVVSPEGIHQRKKDDLSDIATLTGANFISHERGQRLEDLTLDDLGTCKKFISDSKTSTIIEGGGSKKEIKNLENVLALSIKAEEDQAEQKSKKDRLARLTGGIATIKVGGKTDSEQKEADDRVDDAIKATRSAQEEGYVPGAGVSYLYAELIGNHSTDLNRDEKKGWDIVYKAVEAPFKNILNNISVSPGNVIRSIRRMEGKFHDCITGYNALNRKIVTDMYLEGIIDPTKVVRTALQNAVSVASLLLTSKTIIIAEVAEQ